MKKIFRDKADEIMTEVVSSIKQCEPGGLPFLFGRKKSVHSPFIKIGGSFESWFKFIVENTDGFELLPSGLTKNIIRGKRKDIDFIFKNEKQKTIYYMELKSNIGLDTEKLPATYKKVSKIENFLQRTYKDYKIVSGILTWSIYDKNILSKLYLFKIKECENYGIRVFFPKDVFEITNQKISERSYYSLFKQLGKKFKF